MEKATLTFFKVTTRIYYYIAAALHYTSDYTIYTNLLGKNKKKIKAQSTYVYTICTDTSSFFSRMLTKSQHYDSIYRIISLMGISKAIYLKIHSDSLLSSNHSKI